MKKLINFFVINSNKIKIYIAITLFKIGLIPKEFEGRAKSFYLRKKYDKIFLKSKIKYHNKGYYYLDPSMSADFLNEYYEKTYWKSRSDIDFPVRLRDIQHFSMITNYYKSFNSSQKKILNFGSGHGGVSYLFHAANHIIYNYDYGPTKKDAFPEKWNNINSLKNLDFKFDLIYGSHSLEHVQNINETLESFEKVSKPESIFFFEVPNCYYDSKISPPHTYYFTRDFFTNHFSKVNFCKTFANFEEATGDKGHVIRFHTCLK
jgi:SAM-dependent methyltransferase